MERNIISSGQELNRLLSATCDLCFYSSASARTIQQNWRKYRGLCKKRPYLGCTYMVIQTNRLYTVQIFSFSTQKTWGTSRRGALQSPAVPRAAQGRGLLPWMPQPWGHATWAFHRAPEGQYGILCTRHHCYSFYTLNLSTRKKSTPRKPGAVHRRHFYWNSSNKKISKTSPDRFQARFEEKNGETKAVEATSIYIFQRSCLQFPAKGFSCDEQGCKTQKQDTVFLWFFSGSRVRNPCPSLSSGHSSFAGDGKLLSQRVVLLSQTLMLNCHKSIPTWMLRLLATLSPFPPLCLYTDRSPASSHVTKSTFRRTTKENQNDSPRGCWLRPAPRVDDTQDDQPKKKCQVCVSVRARTCAHTHASYFIFLFNWN